MLTDWDCLLRVVVAAALAGLVGWERERLGKAAGLRTHLLVGLASALFICLMLLMGQSYQSMSGSTPVRVDVSRAIQAVALGISFLGSGIVFVSYKRGEKVRGLTTAAAIWATAAVGAAAGLGRWVLAVGTAVLVYLILRVLRWVERDKGHKPEANREELDP